MTTIARRTQDLTVSRAPFVHATVVPVVQFESVAAAETPHTCTVVGATMPFGRWAVFISSTLQSQLSSIPLHCSMTEVTVHGRSQPATVLSQSMNPVRQPVETQAPA